MTRHFDAVVIGAGQAGPPLASRLAASGRRVAMIERGAFGGTCVNNGCIPTKTLIASAYAAHTARRGAEYGFRAGGIEIDMHRVKARKDEIVARSRKRVERWMREHANVTVFEGAASFEAAKRVRVGEELLEADQVFVNVGGRPLVPKLPGVDDVRYLTNESMMDLDTVPEHLVVVGGSYIGLEFGQMVRRFGAKVTIVEMGPRLIAREDEDVSSAVQTILESEGIGVRLSAECIALRRRGGRVEVCVDCAAGAPAVDGSHVLLAVGRVPNTGGLGLERAGIATDARGYISVDDRLQTSVPGVYALGDCNGRGAFTHTAYNDFEIVAANLLEGGNRKLSDRIATYALFIDPPLGRIGMTDTEARQSGRKLLTAMRPMSRVGRAVEKGESLGFMKVVVDAETKQLLGAAILGVTGDEVIHTLLDVMYVHAPYTTITRAMHIHPTVSELLPTLLGDLAPMDSAGSR